ncbi:MAG: hypothetical protein P8J32_07925 [bacterium]|nr:hypothetical protein [bacterium]
MAAPGVQACNRSPADISGGEVCNLLTFALADHEEIFVYAADLITLPGTTHVAFNPRMLLVDRSDDTDMYCVILPEMTCHGTPIPCSRQGRASTHRSEDGSPMLPRPTHTRLHSISS